MACAGRAGACSGLAAARELYPTETIVLDGVDTSLFWDVIPDGGSSCQTLECVPRSRSRDQNRQPALQPQSVRVRHSRGGAAPRG